MMNRVGVKSVAARLPNGLDWHDLQRATIEVPLKIEIVERLDERANYDGTSRRAVTEYFVNAVLNNIRKRPHNGIAFDLTDHQPNAKRVLVGINVDASDYDAWERYARSIGKDVPEYVSLALDYQMKLACHNN